MGSESRPSPDRLRMAAVLAAFGLAVLAVFSLNNSFYADYQRYLAVPPDPERLRPVRLTLDFGDGQRRAFRGQPSAGLTVFAALRASQEAGKFLLQVDDGGRIMAIAGYPNGQAGQWKLYVNDMMPSPDLPGHVSVDGGDEILFRYEAR